MLRQAAPEFEFYSRRFHSWDYPSGGLVPHCVLAAIDETLWIAIKSLIEDFLMRHDHCHEARCYRSISITDKGEFVCNMRQ